MPTTVTAIIITFLLGQYRTADCSQPNLCDEKGTVQCENYQTCCLFSSGQYGCCPFTEANCCPTMNSCCPAGFRCGNDSCIRM